MMRPQGPGGRRLREMPENKVWRTMISRCHNVRDKDYPRYGGRGIRVCQRWLERFEEFYADMGPRPAGVGQKGRSLYSIERVDNDKGYEPGNCVWATQEDQAANRRPMKRRQHFVDGEAMSRREALVRAGVTGQAVRARMKKGMTFEEAVLMQRDPRGRPKKAG